MKKLLTLLLLLLLPLHFSWAIAAAYCQHEQEKDAAHFGHHAHAHKTAEKGKSDSDQPTLKLHGDCSICQISGTGAAESPRAVAATTAQLFTIADPGAALPSIIHDRPERPKWGPAA